MNNVYTCVEELLSDESFLLYCNHTDAGTAEEWMNGRGIGEWRNWMDSDPSRKALAEQALKLLKAIREAEKQITEIEERQMSGERVPTALKALMTCIERIG